MVSNRSGWLLEMQRFEVRSWRLEGAGGCSGGADGGWLVALRLILGCFSLATGDDSTLGAEILLVGGTDF